MDPRSRTVQAFCRLVGAPDLHTWLQISPKSTAQVIRQALERRRRELERALRDPARSREAEAFIELFDVIHDTLMEGAAPPTDLDPYAALGLTSTASFADINAAYRDRQRRRPDDAQLKASWAILGDPVARAAYDRARSEKAREASSSLPPFDPDTTDARAFPLDEPAARARVIGPAMHEVSLHPRRGADLRIPIQVLDDAPWSARVAADHPCLQPSPAPLIELQQREGHIHVHFDPKRSSNGPFTCSLRLSNRDEDHLISFRVRPQPTRTVERGVLIGAALALLALGYGIGFGAGVRGTGPGPSSAGHIAQLSGAADCVAPRTTESLQWLDVHIDGLGRPTGMSVQGSIPEDTERCLRKIIRQLDFPATTDGQPTYHRYHAQPLSPDPNTP